jgi:hypothetical protein
MPSEVVKTRKIVSSVSLAVTEEDIIGYILAGVRRDHKDVKGHELKVTFDRIDLRTDELGATVSGERVG